MEQSNFLEWRMLVGGGGSRGWKYLWMGGFTGKRLRLKTVAAVALAPIVVVAAAAGVDTAMEVAAAIPVMELDRPTSGGGECGVQL
jgi:hypothetical protein